MSLSGLEKIQELTWRSVGRLGNHYLGYSFLSPLSVVSQNPSEDYNFLSTVSMACAMLINQISEGEHMTAIEPFNSDIKNTFFRKPTGFLTNQINQFFI